jgi:spermidine synthase
VIEYFNEQKNDEGLNIGVVGLGIGTLASYLKVDDQLRFYEIDPKIVKIAQDKFTFLLRSKGHISIKLGDGRILLDQEKEQKYDILLIDAFNSDAIPTHLLTTEAFKIYRKHLNQNGVLVFHVTNTFLTLDKICEKNAMDLNLISLTLNAAPTNVYQAESTYTIVSESDQFIVQVKKLLDTNQYKNIKIINNSESEKIKTWTDSYSNIFSVMKVDTKRIRH